MSRGVYTFSQVKTPYNNETTITLATNFITGLIHFI